jgi:hypothetical protein
MDPNSNDTSNGRTPKHESFGALVISLDFEIHWGVRDLCSPNGSYRHHLLGVRRAVPQMLDLFEEFDIGATWATVGFLFATSRRELKNHFPAVRPAYEDPILCPYQESIGHGEGDDPLHFAPSLIEEILGRRRQEVGTHTHSHYYCLEQGQTREAFQADLESAVQIALSYGCQLQSIVFPRSQHNPHYADVLAEAGIVCYRGRRNGRLYEPAATNRSKVHLRGLRLLDHYLSLSGTNLVGWDEVSRQNGLGNVKSSGFLRPYSPRLRHFDSIRLSRIVKSIHTAAVSNRILHLNWHPHNFGVHTEENIAFLRRVFEAYARFRDSHSMRSLTMAEVAAIAKERSGVIEQSTPHEV